MRPLATLSILVLLAACAVPPGTCRSALTPELERIDALIAETRLNLDRGYAMGRTTTGGGGFNVCVGGGGDNVGVSLCTPGTATTRTGPVAIDPVAEREKLAALEARRAELARRIAAEIAACEAARS
ncbi:hypothetical protein [Ostreiculturibacter nitratireducens]|uniref:hypothetical protein n=1 Tax=Ostreiculturibacter nitratireducens TaxID=3075226 RepID=UPI0031B5ECF2